MTADCLCFRARRVSRVITRLYDESLRPLGIQATQLTLLNAIAMSGERKSEVGRSDAAGCEEFLTKFIDALVDLKDVDRARIGFHF